MVSMYHASRTDRAYHAFRSQVIDQVRDYFKSQGVLEVFTPLLRAHTVTDPYIDSIKTPDGYLQTSPEMAMKILLGHGSRDIFQLLPVFRDEPILGAYHQREFLLLEWYRVDMHYKQLMQEVTHLIQLLCGNISVTCQSLQEALKAFYQCDLWQLSDNEIEKLTREHIDVSGDLQLNDCYDFLIEKLVKNTTTDLVVFHGFPKSMQLMSRFDNNTNSALRFECYLWGHEIANGFSELNDPIEQRQRFDNDNHIRQMINKPNIALDNEFLESLRGMPDCSGVALGIDRLIWILLDRAEQS